MNALKVFVSSHTEQMGRILQRTSISTNIKERLDFSCAVFGPDGGLVSNAPHIPVHLGAMQETVQYQVHKHITEKPWSAFIWCQNGNSVYILYMCIYTVIYFTFTSKTKTVICRFLSSEAAGRLCCCVCCFRSRQQMAVWWRVMWFSVIIRVQVAVTFQTSPSSLL